MPSKQLNCNVPQKETAGKKFKNYQNNMKIESYISACLYGFPSICRITVTFEMFASLLDVASLLSEK